MITLVLFLNIHSQSALSCRNIGKRYKKFKALRQNRLKARVTKMRLVFVFYLGLGFPNPMNTTIGLPVGHKTIRYRAN